MHNAFMFATVVKSFYVFFLFLTYLLFFNVCCYLKTFKQNIQTGI